jgi:hypothetical protein
MRYLSLTAIAFLLCSCSHAINLRGFDAKPVVHRSLEKKRVAIVIDRSRIQDNHSTSSDVHTFKFSGATDGLSNALKVKFEPNVKSIEIVDVSEITDKSDYDLYLYPDFSIRSVNDFWTFGCLVKFRLDVKLKDKKLATSENAEAKRNFPFISAAENKCREATSEVFEVVSSRVLGNL